MIKFAFGAVAVFAAGATSFANDEGEEWLTLDQEIETLASSLSQGGSGVGVSGWVKTSYMNTSDTPEDTSGFSIDSVRLMFDGSIGTTSVHVSAEGSNDPGWGVFGYTGQAGGSSYVPPSPSPSPVPVGTQTGLGILDAYATFRITDQITGTAGQFRAPVQADGLRNLDELLFIDRTVVGQTWAFRDQGVMVSGMFDMIGFDVALQNGVDGATDDLAYMGRVIFNALGTGTGSVEGAYGADDGSALTASLGYWDDSGTNDDMNAWTLDADFTFGALYAGASIVGNGDGMGFLGLPVDPTGGTTLGSTPWDLTASYMVAEDSWEVGGRWQNLDDDDSTTVLSFVVNKYMEGHDAKWQIQYSTSSSDVDVNELNVLQLGLTASV